MIAASQNRFLDDNPFFRDIELHESKKSENSPLPISIRESKFRNGWIRIWYVINRDTLLSSLIFFPFRESEFVRIDKNRDLKLFLFLSIIISWYEKNN